MEIVIDYAKMSQFKEMFMAINKQIVNDYIGDNGSYLPKEDAQTAAIICLLTKSYSVKKAK